MAKPSKDKDQIETELEEVNGNIAVNEESPALESFSAAEPEQAKDKGYGLVFDDQLKKWVAVELLYNYKAGTFGGLKVIEQNVSKRIIDERVEVLFAQNLLR